MNVLLTMWMGHRVTPPSITIVSIVTRTKTHPCSFSHSHSYLPGKIDDIHMEGFQVFHNPPTWVSLLGLNLARNYESRCVWILELHATPNKCHRLHVVQMWPCVIFFICRKTACKVARIWVEPLPCLLAGLSCVCADFLGANTRSWQEESITHRLWRTELVWDWRKHCGFNTWTVSWSDHRLLDPLLAVKTEWQ